MARLKVDTEDVEKALRKVAREFGSMEIKVVDKYAPILEKAFKSEITAAANRNYATGALADSITTTPAKHNTMGVYSVAHVTGDSKSKLDRTEQLFYLEYGRGGQEPRRGIRTRAINSVGDQIANGVEEELYREVSKVLE